MPMNLPYTMGIEQAAEGTLEFAPGIVYRYHYRGKSVISDTEAFAGLVSEKSDAMQVALRGWYA